MIRSVTMAETSADRFQARWQGRRVAAFKKAHGLPRGPRRHQKYEAITLERGVTHDAEFEQWANEVSSIGDATPGEELRRDLTIEVYDEAGRLSRAYRLLRSWVSEYQALPDLDASANAVAIEHIKLEHEGIERDEEVPLPQEPCPDP